MIHYTGVGKSGLLLRENQNIDKKLCTLEVISWCPIYAPQGWQRIIIIIWIKYSYYPSHLCKPEVDFNTENPKYDSDKCIRDGSRHSHLHNFVSDLIQKLPGTVNPQISTFRFRRRLRMLIWGGWWIEGGINDFSQIPAWHDHRFNTSLIKWS